MNSLKLKMRGVYRVHRPAAVIVTLLLASGDIESNPGPVQYPCTVCEKPVKRNQRGILCDGCSQWTHARCGGVEEAEYLLLTAQESCEWFCPLCTQSTASLSISGINNSLTSLQPIIDVVNTIQTDAKHPDVSETSLHHSGSHSEDRAKKRSTKNRNYYERHKTRILLRRKQRYQENAEVVKTVSRAASKVNYARNPQPKKDAARAVYVRNPQPKKKDAARAASKVNYARNPKIKIGHSRAHYVKNKQSICAKRRDKYSLCEPKLPKIEMYLQEIQANLLENSKARLALIKALKKQHETQAEQARGVLGKTACRLAAKRLLNKALQVRKEHAGCLLKMARSIQNLQIKGKNDFGESSHTASTEPYFYDSAYQLVKRPHAIPIDENEKCIIAKSVKKESAWKQWQCTNECKGITPSEELSIVTFKQSFECSIQEVRRTLDKCDECPHTHYTKTSGGFAIDHEGHPLICSIGTECKSQLRILRAAATHYPMLRKFLHDVHTAIRSHVFVHEIDQALCAGDFRALMELTEMTNFETMLRNQRTSSALIPLLGQCFHN